MEIITVTKSGETSAKKTKGTQIAVRVSRGQSILFDLYSSDSEIQEDTWPPQSCKTFVNLAFLSKEAKMDKKSEFAHTLQGDVDDILNKKQSIEYDEAFGEYKSGFTLIRRSSWQWENYACTQDQQRLGTRQGHPKRSKVCVSGPPQGVTQEGCKNG